MLFIIWIITFVAAIALRFAVEPAGISLFFVSILAGIFVLAYLFSIKSLGGVRSNFIGILFVVFFFLNFVLRGIVLAFYSDPYYSLVNTGYDDLLLAMIYALLGLGFLLLGYHLKSKSLRAERWGRFVFDRDFASPGLYLFSLVGVVSMFIVSLIVFSPSSLASTVSSIPTQIGYLGLYSTLILLYETKRLSKFRLTWCLMCLLVYAAGYFILGMRWVLVFIFLYALLYLLMKKGSFKEILKEKTFWILAMTTIMIIITLFPIMSVYKGYMSSSFYSLSEGERFEEAVKTYLRIYSGDLLEQETSSLGYLLENLSRRSGTGLDSLSILISNTPAIWDFQYGKTFLLGFISPVPRALWPSKPDTNLEGKFYEEYLGRERSYGRGAAGYTTVGDFWLNFHIVGVIVGAFLLGIFLKFFQIFCVGREMDTERTAGMVFLIVVSPLLVETTRSISAMVSGLFGMSIIPLFFLLLIGKRRVESPS